MQIQYDTKTIYLAVDISWSRDDGETGGDGGTACRDGDAASAEERLPDVTGGATTRPAGSKRVGARARTHSVWCAAQVAGQVRRQQSIARFLYFICTRAALWKGCRQQNKSQSQDDAVRLHDGKIIFWTIEHNK